MFLNLGRKASLLSILACTGLLASTPVAAMQPHPPRPASVQAWDGEGSEFGYHRRYRHRDRGVRTGDIIAGVLAVGAIAVLASSASRERDEPRRAQPVRDPGRTETSGLGRAVDMCVAEIERSGERVVEVGNASRDAGGWLVFGDTARGEDFSCRIGNDGRIGDIDFGARFQGYGGGGEDRQYADAVYARVRASQRAYGPYTETDPYAQQRSDGWDTEPRPAYPGGPLPGEEGYDDYRYDGY